MEVHYIRLEFENLDVFIKMRIKQLIEEGAECGIDLYPNLLDYYTKHLLDDSFVAWIAISKGEIIATSGLSIVEKPPYFSCPSGKIGLLSSMYTKVEYRRKGIGKELLKKIIDEAKKRKCGTIQITASDMGVKLYNSCGFIHNENFMQLVIS